MTRLEVRLLGPFGVLADGEPVDVSAGRSSALLAVLAMSAGKVVSIERLADMVWGEELPANSRRSVQTYVTRLRAALGGQTISTAGAGYVLNLDPDNVDALCFLRLLDSADADPATERDRVVDALKLWRGNPLEGVQSAWLADYERPRLVERYLSALERRIDLDIAAGRAGDLVAEVRDVAGQHSLRESMWARLIVVLDRCGRQAEALECYETIRSRIAGELGVDPGPELQRIYADLLQGKPAESTERSASVGPAPSEQLVPRQLPADIDGFTGREDALAALDALIDPSDDAADRTEQPVVITALHGAGGIGKTTLAVHWAHRVADRFPDGQLYLNLRGFGPGDPMAPAEALEVLLRGLGVSADQVPADIDARSALLRTMLADRRVLMLLDNARDAEQVRPLLPGGGGALVVVTSRSQLRGLAAREGAGRVAVDTLSLDDATAMLAAGLEGQRVVYDGESLAELARLCGHLPLALAVAVERAGRYPDSELADLIAELRDEHERLDALDTGDDPLTSVRAVFSWSYQALDEDTGALFRLVGRYLGGDFSLPAVAALGGLTTVRARRRLDALTDVNLLRRSRHGRYVMHDLLRAYAAELHDQTHGEEAAVLRLVSWYVYSAAAASTMISTDRDPRFMDMGEPAPGIVPLTFADSRQSRDWFDAEWLTLTRVVTFAAEHDEPVAAYRLVNKLYNYLESFRPPAEAIGVQQIGTDAAATVGHRVDEGFLTNQLGISYGRLGDFERCIEHLERAKELFRSEQHLGGEQMVLINLGIAYRSTGQHDEALRNLQRALELRLDEEHGGDTATVWVNLSRVHLDASRPADAVDAATRAVEDLRGKARSESEAVALETLGMAYAAQQAYSEADRCFRQALEVHRELGHRWREAVTLANLGRVDRDTGQPDAARDSWQRALVILDEIGEMDSTDLSRAELVDLIESVRD